jgi:hypothetical protein
MAEKRDTLDPSAHDTFQTWRQQTEQSQAHAVKPYLQAPLDVWGMLISAYEDPGRGTQDAQGNIDSQCLGSCDKSADVCLTYKFHTRCFEDICSSGNLKPHS